MTANPANQKPTPGSQLRSFLGNFDPQDQRIFRAIRNSLRKRFPAANGLVCDSGRSAAIASSPTEPGIESLASIALRADAVRLCFTHGPRLAHPKRLLREAGQQARFVEALSARASAQPEIEAPIAGAAAKARIPPPTRGRGHLVLQTADAKPRLRRP